MRVHLGFLSRKSSESPLSTRPLPEEAKKWSECFTTLMTSKCNLIDSQSNTLESLYLTMNSFFVFLQTDRHFTGRFYSANTATRTWNFGWPSNTTGTPNPRRWQPKRNRFTKISWPFKHPKKYVVNQISFDLKKIIVTIPDN